MSVYFVLTSATAFAKYSLKEAKIFSHLVKKFPNYLSNECLTFFFFHLRRCLRNFFNYPFPRLPQFLFNSRSSVSKPRTVAFFIRIYALERNYNAHEYVSTRQAPTTIHFTQVTQPAIRQPQYTRTLQRVAKLFAN